jgi:hypothetical protein
MLRGGDMRKTLVLLIYKKLLMLGLYMFMLVLFSGIVLAVTVSDINESVILYASFDTNCTGDDSIFSNQGAVTGTVPFIETGKVGGSCNFTTSGTYTTFTHITPYLGLDTGWTQAFWVKTNSVLSSDYRVATYKIASNAGFSSYVYHEDRANKVGFYISDSSETQNGYAEAYTLNPLGDGNWHYVVAVNNATHYTIWIDGVQQTPFAFTLSTANTGNLTVGARPGDYGLNGLLDEVVFSNTSWTQADIDFMYNSGVGRSLFGGESEGVSNFTNITAIYLTSPDPDQQIAYPLVTGNTTDLTPTFNITTNETSQCYLSTDNATWTIFSTTGGTGHIGTQPTDLGYGLVQEYFKCNATNNTAYEVVDLMITDTQAYGNVTLTSCLSSFTIKPLTGNSTNVTPTGQTTCAFNVTNLNDTALRFDMRYNGNLGYYHHYYLDSFISLKPNMILEQTWVNDTLYNFTYYHNETDTTTYEGQYNFTKLCMNGVIESDELVLRYNFNNSEDNLVDIWGNESFDNATNITTIGWTQINTTFGCPDTNYIQFNITNSTRENFTRYETISIDYRLKGTENKSIKFLLNVSNATDSVSSAYQTIDQTNQTLVLNISLLGRENLTNYKIQLNGSVNGQAIFDNLILNDTDVEQKINFYVGNDTYVNAINLTSTYQPIFNISSNGAMPLKFWFDFFFPLLGTKLDLNLLEYQAVVI